MQTITLTREFSDFQNLSDNWIIGEDDSNSGTIDNYILPDGFSVGTDWSGEVAVFGPDNMRCDIVSSKKRRNPQLLDGKINPILKPARKSAR